MKTNHRKTISRFTLALVTASALAALAPRASAQAGVPAWVQRYSHPVDAEDRAQKVVTDNAGNVIVVGYTDDGFNGQDFLIIKYSSAGAPIWTNRYNGPANVDDLPTGVAVDGSGNVFVTGHSATSNNDSYPDYDYATIKYSSAGVPLWTNLYNGPGNDWDMAAAVAVDGNGNVFVTGLSGTAYATVAYSSAGVPLWTNRYATLAISYDSANAVAVDSGGNVFVTANSWNGTNFDYATIKYSGAGVPLWTNRYATLATHEQISAIAVDGSGNVFVLGSSLGSGSSWDYAAVAYSSAGTALWTNRYNGPGNGDDHAYAVAVDSNGNVFVTGRSLGIGSSYDYATIKYSGAGAPLWTNRCPGVAQALAVDSSGKVFVTGYSYGIGFFRADFATVAYSNAGLSLWTNRYNGRGNDLDYAQAVAVDSSGQVFVTGRSVGSDRSWDYATVAYSSAGTALWTNRYTGAGDDYVSAITVDGSGNVFVTGESFSIIGGNHSDYATIKYSNAGVPLWTNRYTGPAGSGASPDAIAADGSGNVFVTGSSGSDYATVAYSGAGVPLWTNRYDANDGDHAHAIAVDGNGNVVVTGESNGWKSGTFYDYVTIKYSSAGVPLWTNRYNGPGNNFDQAYAVAVDGSGNVFVTGSSIVSGSDSDYTTIKYSAAGPPLWTNRYDGSGNGNDSAGAVAVDGSGNVIVTGYSYGGASSNDYATIKYSGAGVPLWTNRYNGPGNNDDVAYAVAVDGSGNVFVAGASLDSFGANADYATIAYSGAGVPLWTNRFNGAANGDDQPQSKSCLALGPDGAVYVTGRSDGNHTTYTIFDFATVKYVSAPLLTIEQDGGSAFNIHIHGMPGATYRLQRATSVTGTWTNLATNTAPAAGLIEYHENTPPPGQAFYRTAQP